MFMTLKRAKIMAIVIAALFLLIHLFIINMFYQCGVYPMVYFNVFSIMFYVVMIYAAYKGFLQFFSVQ